jgi:hypothetical protein
MDGVECAPPPNMVRMELLGSPLSAALLKFALEDEGLDVQLEVPDQKAVSRSGALHTFRCTLEARGEIVLLISGVRVAIQATRKRSPGVEIRVIGHEHDEAPPECKANVVERANVCGPLERGREESGPQNARGVRAPERDSWCRARNGTEPCPAPRTQHRA